MISRRGLLGMFAAGAAAAIVRPGLIMPIKPAIWKPFTTEEMVVAWPKNVNFLQDQYAWFVFGNGEPQMIKFSDAERITEWRT